MGFLHDGHLSLVKRALQENDACAVSIFVNAAQFDNPDDFLGYPEDLRRDLSMLRRSGVDLVFTPKQEIMYPEGFSSKVTLMGLSELLEGASRPGHFDGVTTVVNKLFNIVQPDHAYFGRKDAQQLIIIKKMVKDLDMNLKISGCPICREENGLAMSSRNKKLTLKQRSKAKVLCESLKLAEKWIQQGENDSRTIIKSMTEYIRMNRWLQSI